jgi:ParB family transcriptional regulator, chromosome partitioning protein
MSESASKPSRLDLVRSGRNFDLPRTGRLVVGIDKIVESPRNERKTFRNMDGLVASVKAVGVVEPITVTAVEDGRYQIITGHRRYRAARAAGLSQTEVLIREPEDDRAQRRKSLVSNVQREDVGPVELAEALQELLDDANDISSQAELAEAIGKDKTWVSAMLRILTLPAHLREKVGTSQVPLSWESVARIARFNDVAAQEELIGVLLDGATHQEIRERIRGRLDRRPTHEAPRARSSRRRQVYRTTQGARVIVESDTEETLGTARTIAALREALRAAEDSTVSGTASRAADSKDDPSAGDRRQPGAL